MQKPCAIDLLFKLSWTLLFLGLTGQTFAMDCSKLLDHANDLASPMKLVDRYERSPWSSDAAPFTKRAVMSVIEFDGIPDHYLLLDKSAEVCRSDGCTGQIYSFAHGYSYYSEEFYVTELAVVFSWEGDSEVSMLWQFSDVLPEDVVNQVGFYVSFEKMDFITFYAVGVDIKRPSEWLSFGGEGYGGIPSRYFSYMPSSTKPSCST